MSTTLDFELKEFLPLLTKDGRWNVLTVLILHCNIRNRCAVGMDVIAELGTNGNKTKATRAKKWLEQHGAFELVPYAKRVDKERDLPKRQHVYQLTGILKSCGSANCECKSLLTTRKYLHHGEIHTIENITRDEVLNGDNISAVDVPPIENFNRAKVLPIEIINGENVSLYKDKEQKKKIRGTKTPRQSDPLFDAVKTSIFGIEEDATGGRIAKISNWLAGKYEGRGAQKVGKIKRPAEPSHIAAFAKHCKEQGMTPPRDLVKFVENWRAWASSANGHKTPLEMPPPELADDWGVDRFVPDPEANDVA